MSLNPCNMDAHRLVGLSSPIEVYIYAYLLATCRLCTRTFIHTVGSNSRVNVSECGAIPIG
jgi:hypothetical protein